MNFFTRSAKIIITVGITLNLSLLILQAQDAETTEAPTAAPSKTPVATEIPTESETTPEATAVPSAGGITPKTQADLEVLTGNVQRPNGFAWHDGKLYTACTGDWTLYEIDAETGSTAQYIYGVRNAHTLYPTIEDGEFTLWIPDFQSNNFVRLNNSAAPQPIGGEIESPWGITALNENEFGITSLAANKVVAVSKEGEMRDLITGLRSPTGIASDDEFIYVANTGSSRRAIEWFEQSALEDAETVLDSTAEETHSLVSGIQNVTNITLAEDGYLYFAYSLGTRGVVGRILPQVCRENGGCTSAEIEIVVYTELAAPLAGVTISPDMKLYIHTMFSPDIYWIQLENAEAN